MISRIARAAVVKKAAFTVAAAGAIYTYAQECKNDVIYFTKSK